MIDETNQLTALAFGPIAAAIGFFLFWGWARARSGPKVLIEVQVGAASYRAVQSPPVFWAVCALTGVSVSVAPLSLFMFGHQGVSGSDWRVLACFLVTYLVPLVYMRLGSPVLEHAWKHRHDSLSSDPA